MDEARGQRRRHAVDNAAVALAVAAGDQRGALGEFVLAAFAVEHELIERGLDHRQGRGQFLQVDQPASVRVGRRQEGRRRPAGAVGAVAPRDAAQIDRVQQQGADIDILAAGLRRDLLGDLTLGAAWSLPRPPPVGGLRPAAPGCWRVRSGAASNRRRWYRARSWHAPGWQVGWMSCGADGPLGRPASLPRRRRAPALPGVEAGVGGDGSGVERSRAADS